MKFWSNMRKFRGIFFLLAAVGAGILIYSCNKKSTEAVGPTRPASPTNLVGAAMDSVTVSLSWQDNANNEDGFRIYYWNGVEWDIIGTIKADSTYYIVPNLWPGTEYRYRVKAFNEEGESDFSNTATVRTYFHIPSAPQNVTATALSYNRVLITWSDMSDDEIGFAVQRHTVTDTFVTVVTTMPNDTFYEDNYVASQTLYYYRVGAVGRDVTGWSNVDTTTTKTDLVSGAPSNLAATFTVGDGIKLTWQDNSNDETFFIINRHKEEDNYRRLDSVETDCTTYTDQAVLENHIYTYQVQARITAGYTIGSNEVSVYYGYSSSGAIPLAPGNIWEYGAHNGETYDISVSVLRADLLDSTLDSPRWFLIRHEDESTGEVDTTTYLLNMVTTLNSGVFYREQGSDEASILWKYPVEKGDSYLVDGDTVKVVSIEDSITVPARTFLNCISYQRSLSSEFSIKTWIKPGIGIIRVESFLGGESYSIQELESYTIFAP